MGSTASKHDEGTQPNTILILRSICSTGGLVQLSELCDDKFFSNSHDAKSFLDRQPHYFRLEGNQVYAHTSAKICDEYVPKQDDCRVPGCSKFHLCKHFVTGSCKYGTGCTSSHDVQSTHNQKVVEAHQLSDLDDATILSLLKLNCVDVCKFYNARGCKNEATCTFLHVCLHYIKGDCKFGGRCRLSHNILDQQPRKVLLNFGIDVGRDPKDLVRMVRLKKGGQGTDGDDTVKRKKGTGKSDEKLQRQPSAADAKGQQYVCMFHLGGTCDYNEKCFNMHTEEPFQWQWKRQNDKKWENFVPSGNLETEKAFCDPNQNSVNLPIRDSAGKKMVGTVDFSDHENYRITYVDGITPYDRDVRRIGTRFKSQGWRSALTTWLWYWEDDNGKFVEYRKQNDRGAEAGICSNILEEAYRSFCSEEHVGRQTGRHQYEIDFTKMNQVNQSLGSERRVRRRPQFATKEDINGRIKRQKHASTASSLIPSTWDKDVMSESEDFKLCAIANATGEYVDISRRFLATMPSASIVSIERVQNVELWEEFCRKRGKMEKKNKGSSVREELLFHGTTENVLNAICQQNFDHRLSGTRVGAKFGQGAYFHKSAKYSDGFARVDASGCKRMFQARVLVGACAKGSKDLRRPPPKDPRRPLEDFYDTCVDNSANPSIFVTFENNQVYPEYIITYSTRV